MTGFDHVVVALGCADGDASLIAYASMLAKLGGTKEVRFVHVAESSAPAAKVREQMRAKVAAEFSGTARTECDVLHGPLTDRLLACVTEFQADLILIGSKKHKLGARLAMVAPCSVGVIPNGYPARLSHLMLAIDFSDAAADTLEWATGLAAADPAIRCTALHVMTHESADLFAENESEPEQAEAMRKILARADRNGVTVTPALASAGRTGHIGRAPSPVPSGLDSRRRRGSYHPGRSRDAGSRLYRAEHARPKSLRVDSSWQRHGESDRKRASCRCWSASILEPAWVSPAFCWAVRRGIRASRPTRGCNE